MQQTMVSTSTHIIQNTQAKIRVLCLFLATQVSLEPCLLVHGSEMLKVIKMKWKESSVVSLPHER